MSDLIALRVKRIVTELEVPVLEDVQAGRNAQGEAEHVNQGICPVAGQIPEGDHEFVGEHGLQDWLRRGPQFHEITVPTERTLLLSRIGVFLSENCSEMDTEVYRNHSVDSLKVQPGSSAFF